MFTTAALMRSTMSAKLTSGAAGLVAAREVRLALTEDFVLATIGERATPPAVSQRLGLFDAPFGER